jgi:2-dehydropantoate 2-reductase
MRLLVLGAGAIGGYFGGRLAESGADVTFLVRPKRRQQLHHDGLRIQSPAGNVTRHVQMVIASELKPGYDIVLLTCKAYDLDSSMDAIAPAMNGRCVVIPMLNGMAHLDRLDERFGRAHVLGGTCMINTMLGTDGVILHGDPLHRIVFGERDPSQAPAATAFANALKQTNVEWERVDDIEQTMWEKIVFLSALAATSCLFRANVGEIMRAPGGREAVERTMATNVEIARREGHAPRPPAIEFGRARLMDPAGTWSASMLRDVEAGGPAEIDHIIGWMLEKARKHGLDDTMLSLAYTHLKAYEIRRLRR